MRHIHKPLAMLALLITSAAFAADGDLPTGAPDDDEVRAKIDALIAQFHDHASKATLGMVQQSIDLSISFGAPAWNDGDHAACCNFYIKTAESLCKAFPDEKSATPLAWSALTDLKRALDRVKTSKDVDQNAWTMRYAFDKAAVTLSIETARASAMMELGGACLKRGNYPEAEDAFTTATGVTRELAGQPLPQASTATLVAPTALVDALFAQHKYAMAAKILPFALEKLPELPKAKRDMFDVFGDPALFPPLLDDLVAQAKKSPKDPALQLMLGYEYYYSGRKASARTQFEKTMELDKDNPVAKEYLKHIKPAEQDRPDDRSRQDL